MIDIERGSMRTQRLAVVGLVFVTAAVVSAFSSRNVVDRGRDAAAHGGEPVVVLAELFTSEGCSSCPPADDVLTRLISSQPIPGVTVVGLGEHVDYWDRLGWRDPFSSAGLTDRQSQYGATVFRTGSIYTPQMVIDGRLQGIGSDFDAIRRAVLEAAKAPKASITVSAHRAGEGIRVDLHIDAATNLARTEPADVILAITEDRLVTEVRRGENHGRTLRHTAVVRSLMTVGELMPEDRTLTTAVSPVLARDWKSENIRLVGFAQERHSRRIVGVGAVALEAGVAER